MSIKEAAAKVTGALKGKLTDEQWQERIAASQKKLDAYKASILKIAQRNLGQDEIEESFKRIGLPVPPAEQRFHFNIPVTMTRGYTVSATSEAEAAQALLKLIGDNGDAGGVRLDSNHRVQRGVDNTIKRDTTDLLKLRDAAKAAPATDPKPSELSLIEQYAALEAEYEDLRVKVRAEILRVHKLRDYCDSGVNEALEELKLDQLPKKVRYYVDAPVTLTVRQTVDAYTQEDALKLAEEKNKENTSYQQITYGRIIKVTDPGTPTAVVTV